MSFAKNAADQLLGDDAEAERQVHRSRVRNLLMSLGVMGAGAGAAYYLGKDNGANWDKLTGALGAKSKPAPVSHIQNGIDAATNAVGLTGHPTAADPNASQQHALTAPILGAAAGGVAGWNTPGYSKGRSLADIQTGSNELDSPISKRMDAVNKGPHGKAEADLGGEIARSQAPVSPNVKSNSLFQQLAAVGRKGPVVPLAGPTQWLPNLKSMGDSAAVVKGLQSVRDQTGGVHSAGGQAISHDDLAKGVESTFKRQPGELAEQINSFKRLGTAPTWQKLLGGALGGVGGGYLGAAADSAATPTPAPTP